MTIFFPGYFQPGGSSDHGVGEVSGDGGGCPAGDKEAELLKIPGQRIHQPTFVAIELA
jgi:hypothetical protein